MHRRLIFLFILAASTPAFAAEPDTSRLVSAIDYDLPTASVDAESGALLGRDECDQLTERSSDVTVEFQLTVDPTEAEGSVQRLSSVWLYELEPDGADLDCDSSSCIPLDEEVQTSATSVEISLGPQTLLGGRGCEGNRDVFVRIELVEDFEDEDDLTSAEARLRFDLEGPPPPTIERADATQNLLEVELSSEDDDQTDAVRRHVGWDTADRVATSAEEVERVGSIDVDATLGSFDGLELPIDQPIHVYVWSEDEAGNAGDLSEPTEVVPLEAIDYWQAVGEQDAACSTGFGSAGWLPLFALLCLIAARRRRRTIAAALFALTLALPLSASAQSAYVDARVGPYSPGIANMGEFSRYFGDGLRWMVGVDGGWIFADTPVVDATLDGGIGYSAFSGDSITASGREFEDGSTLRVVPMRLGVRAFSAEWSGPLLLSARLGLTGIHYRFGDHGGVAVGPDGTIGRGIQWGWYGSTQIGLDLGIFDREHAARMSSNWSVAQTLLFVEFAYSDVDDFGTSSLDLGDAQIAGGLGFVF